MASDTLHDTMLAARRLQALSDGTRLEIVTRLARGECCVCELTGAMDAAQSRLSFHLKVLKNAGLVTDRREGRWSYYSLDREALVAVSEFVAELGAVPDSGSHPGGCCG